MELILPLNISRKIAEERKVKEIALYLSLRMMYKSSYIKNYHKRWLEIENHTGLNRKTIKKHLKYLRELQLIRIKRGNLFLFGKKRLCEVFDLATQSYYLKIRIDYSTKVKDITLFIRKRVVEETLLKQKYKIRKIHEETTGNSNPRKIEKIERSLEFMINTVYDKAPQLSQKRIAEMLGCKWHSTGRYHLMKLQKEGMLVNKKRDDKFIMRGNKKLFYAFVENNPLHSYYINTKGEIYQRRTNQIEILA